MKFYFLLPLLLLTIACSTPPKYKAKLVESPLPDELMGQGAYVGTWIIAKCQNGKQAEKLSFKKTDNGLNLKRWQWKKDNLPMFQVDIQIREHSTVTYQSKDMHDRNPVINQTLWTWLDRRVVAHLQWQPDKGDIRGPWMGGAMAQFFIKKKEPGRLYWNRWGHTHSSDQGLRSWDSSCYYVREESIIKKKKVKKKVSQQSIIDEIRVSTEEPEKKRLIDLEFPQKSRHRGEERLSL